MEIKNVHLDQALIMLDLPSGTKFTRQEIKKAW